MATGLPRFSFGLHTREDTACPRIFKKGLPWLRKAAEHGSPEGQWVLSTIYEFGRDGVPVDQTEAFKWALKAAQNGHMIAQHNVGDAYLHGQGVEVNPERARYWFGQSADQGFAHAEWELGKMYLDGTGVAPTKTKH
jgi:TPR repeat protein